MDKPFFCPFNNKDCPAMNVNVDWNCPLAIRRMPEAPPTCSFYEIATQFIRLSDYVYEINSKLQST